MPTQTLWRLFVSFKKIYICISCNIFLTKSQKYGNVSPMYSWTHEYSMYSLNFRYEGNFIGGIDVCFDTGMQ